jgi:hypothetical protein
LHASKIIFVRGGRMTIALVRVGPPPGAARPEIVRTDEGRAWSRAAACERLASLPACLSAMKLESPRRILAVLLASVAPLAGAGAAAAQESLRWVRSDAGIPAGTVLGGDDGGRALFVCRARVQGAVLPGKLGTDGCNIAWRGRVYLLRDFEVLVGAARWGTPGEAAVVGGQFDGYALPICRAEYRNGLHPGKVEGSRCSIAWNGREARLDSYEVLYPEKAASQRDWIACAEENQVCRFDGVREVRYGAGTRHVRRSFSGAAPCNNAAFGDPAPGEPKRCEFSRTLIALPLAGGSADALGPEWTWCANQDDPCRFNGTRDVRYGAGTHWVTQRFSGGAACNNATFGDPSPGVRKICEFGPPIIRALDAGPDWTARR